MNYTYCIILLTLTLAVNPALHGMNRLTRPMLATTRTLASRTLQTSTQAIARTQCKTNNEREKFKDDAHGTPNDNLLPMAGITAALSLATHYAMEDQEYSEAIRKLDITDIGRMEYFFTYETEDDKRTAAQMIAKRITSYDRYDIKHFLRATKGRPHRILVNALAKNITHFRPYDIADILEADQQDETHDLIGRALKENYHYFTSYSIAGFKIITAQDGIYAYAKAISKLQAKYKAIALEPLSADLAKKSINEITAIVYKRGGMERQTIITAIAENIHTYKKSAFARIMNAASGNDFKESIVPGIVKNINKYDQASLASILQPHLDQLLFHSTTENGECITTALSKTIEKDLPLYTESNLISIVDYANNETAEQITSLIARDNAENIKKKFTFSALVHFASKAKAQAQDTFISVIVENIELKIDSLDRETAARLLTISKGQHREIIKNAIVKKIDRFIPPSMPDLQKLFIQGATADKTKMVNLLAKNINNLEGPLANLLLASLQENKSTFMNAVIETLDPSIKDHNSDSQSAAHLRSNALEAFNYLRKVMQKNLKFRADQAKYTSIFQNALRQERLLCDQFAVFYHSHKNTNYWLEILYTKLWEGKHNQKASNYLFTRFPDDRNEMANAILQSYGSEKRSELLATGRLNDKDSLRQFLFFTNYALYGNLGELGSCTAHYYLTDFNVRDPEIKTEDIVNRFGNQKIFERYQTEFEALEKEFYCIVQDSVLLQLSIPLHTIKDHVYLASPGGYKKELKISGEATDDIPTIINTLKKAPETLDNSDEQEFCVVMTPDTVHTLREQGAQVNVYGDFDQEKLNALIKKLEALIARIAKEHPTTFSSRMAPTQSYQAYKPLFDELLKKKQ